MVSNRELYLQQCEPIQEEQYLQTFNPYTTVNINLKRPIIFFDVETTGTDTRKDKIVSIAIVKLFPDQSREKFSTLINPGIAIPSSAMAVHGITFEKVQHSPKFKDVAQQIFDFVKDCDVAGYNSNRFDVPILFREFEYAGIFWDYRTFEMIDVCNIFKVMEERTLAAAYKFYLGKELIGAHDATADIEATIEVFAAQLERYQDLPRDVRPLAMKSNYGRGVVDVSGNFYFDEQGEECLAIGKHKGEKVWKVRKEDPKYLDWMIWKADFPHDTRVEAARLDGQKEPSMLDH